MADANAKGGSVSAFVLFALLFVALKLGGVIEWSWWWVLAPLWMPWVALFVLVAGAILFGAFAPPRRLRCETCSAYVASEPRDTQRRAHVVHISPEIHDVSTGTLSRRIYFEKGPSDDQR